MDVSKSFLRFMNEKDLEWWFLSCSDVQAEPGQVLLEEGQDVESILFVNFGELEIRLAAMGAKPVARVGPGGILGEMSLVEEAPASATVVAGSDTLLRVLPKSALRQHIEDDPQFGIRFYRAVARTISERLRESHGVVRELAATKAEREGT
ncbi:MAG: cyclic nucleotide-binding domain-containing protein [Planctomycetes bacterium]|nr:cyclic nucleotide-binding domain-containing protein [Planctomycetota bacterium]